MGFENNIGLVATMTDPRFTRRHSRLTPLASGLVLRVNRDFDSPLKMMATRRRTQMPATTHTAMSLAPLASCRHSERIAIANDTSLCQTT